MGLEQSVMGKVALSFGSVAFAYYSVWILFAPFMGADSRVARFFPPKALATAVPIYVGIGLLCLVTFNVGWSLISAHPIFQRRKNEEWHRKQQ